MTTRNTPAAPMRAATFVRRLHAIGDTFFAMSGWRLGRLNLVWVLGGGLSFAVARSVASANRFSWTLAYYAFSLALYYGGNSLILGSSIAQRAVDRFGENRAYRAYETLLALMFVNQGLGLACMTSLSLGPDSVLPGSVVFAKTVGGAMFAVGLVTKLWSTTVLGVDGYYYRDMFLGRAVSVFEQRGPYKMLSNPMYGVGQAHAYGYAIFNQSMTGVIAAAVCQLLTYAFYFGVERPFVARVYLRRS
jgi:hypothetical protein